DSSPPRRSSRRTPPAGTRVLPTQACRSSGARPSSRCCPRQSPGQQDTATQPAPLARSRKSDPGVTLRCAHEEPGAAMSLTTNESATIDVAVQRLHAQDRPLDPGLRREIVALGPSAVPALV